MPAAVVTIALGLPLVLTIAGCVPQEPAAPVGLLSPSPRPAVAPLPVGHEHPASDARLICAGESGVFDLGSDGSRRIRLSSALNASSPRYVDEGRSIVFLSGGNTLRRLDLATGVDSLIAGPWNTSNGCDSKDLESLEVQTDDDVVLDASERYVCVDLYDRNINMASAGVSVRVDLTTGTFQQRTTLLPEGCSNAPLADSFNCNSPVETEPKAAQFPYSFDEDNFAVIGPSGESFGKLTEFTPSLAAPGGRWVLLRGNQEDADYIHVNLLLLDRLSGSIVPIPSLDEDTRSTWPTPLTKLELSEPSRAKLGKRAGDFVAETTVRFIGPNRLVVGNLLMLLDSERLVGLPGDIVR